MASKHDPKSYYGYLFKKDKTPTEVLDALLRAIAKYIIAEIGDKSEDTLTPTKLAAFYKTVGGDYDSLFLQTPHQSISYIWRATGCQHSLQPTGNDYETPSVPALTLKGFVRWESIEILLGPDEHVPFIQHAVKGWNLKHPDTGEPFPPDLPKEAFPTEPDAQIDKWHQECGEKLRKEASPMEDEPEPKSAAGARDPRSHPGFSHVRNPFNEGSQQGTPRAHADSRSGSDYFGRGVSFAHVPPKYGPRINVQRSPDRDRFRPGTAPGPEEQARRKSCSDQSPPEPAPRPYDARGPVPGRRHSQPRHFSSSEETESDAPPSRTRRRAYHQSDPSLHHGPPPPSIRRVAPKVQGQSPPLNPVPPSPNLRPHRAELRVDESRRKSVPSPLSDVRDKLMGKVSSILNPGPDRPHSSTRNHSHSSSSHHQRREATGAASRLNRSSHSDYDSEESDEYEDRSRRRRYDNRDRERERERERLRERDRGRERAERERERDRDRDRDRDSYDDRPPRTYLQRPDVHRRTSSHADADRRRHDWDLHDPEGLRGGRKRWEGRPQPTPVTGVSGRRYPPAPTAEPAAWS